VGPTKIKRIQVRVDLVGIPLFWWHHVCTNWLAVGWVRWGDIAIDGIPSDVRGTLGHHLDDTL
jgi:hypothetical protein